MRSSAVLQWVHWRQLERNTSWPAAYSYKRPYKPGAALCRQKRTAQHSPCCHHTPHEPAGSLRSVHCNPGPCSSLEACTCLQRLCLDLHLEPWSHSCMITPAIEATFQRHQIKQSQQPACAHLTLPSPTCHRHSTGEQPKHIQHDMHTIEWLCASTPSHARLQRPPAHQLMLNKHSYATGHRCTSTCAGHSDHEKPSNLSTWMQQACLTSTQQRQYSQHDGVDVR